MITMKTIRDIEYFEGVKVLVRADFNVPIVNGAVGDDFRIRAALPTIDFLRNKGAVVILMSHLESIDGDILSLEPIAKHIEKIGRAVTFIKDYKNAHEVIEADLLARAGKGGSVFLLENLRFSEGEKTNDKKFAQGLASLADIYVNEAFSASHREHASIVGVPKCLPSYAGLQFEKEVMHLSKAFNPAHPFLFILGGAKFDTKLPLIERFLKVADTIFLGGALGNDALKARGINVGDSKISDGAIDITAIVNRTNILVPVDSIIQDRSVKNVDAIAAHDHIFDPGPKTLELIQEKINQARFILWNGPLGPYEEGFVEGTEAVARMIAERTKNGGGGKQEVGSEEEKINEIESIVGGGDTLAAIANLGIEDKFTFVSSGGGAMLEFLAKGTLPGIEALNN
jgi:phosphoglycerate kinase